MGGRAQVCAGTGRTMRKAQKEEAENFTMLLGQVHDRIRKDMEKQNIQNALMLLRDCQEGAVTLGTLIEKSEGEGFCTVSLLEDYCELLYQMHEDLAQGDKDSAKKVFKSLKHQLIKISNSVSGDIPVRQEVVFVPYKASMWDSLESVWRAADAAPDCDAYVVPIPYYDKNPDGSFREMHYEGDLYPGDVSVTYYKDYDFESRRPDVIFCHNPYDEYNYVTSVEPFFYTKNLKKYTEKLVYIPYFVLGEVNPDNKEAVKNIEHFVTVPGVMYADKVIVQSEAMRQVYINVMSELIGEHTRKVWEKKILGLGSPKLDKMERMANTRIKDEDIPEEWKSVICKPDGSRKKVILYNISVSAILHHKEKMLGKIESVFGIFRENTDNVALLWRPHPLIKATIDSMHPELWAGYEKLVEEYRNSGWGVYDDTADLGRAIALSDGYYGDPSSLVQLCGKAGIPVMIQDPEI